MKKLPSILIACILTLNITMLSACSYIKKTDGNTSGSADSLSKTTTEISYDSEKLAVNSSEVDVETVCNTVAQNEVQLTEISDKVLGKARKSGRVLFSNSDTDGLIINSQEIYINGNVYSNSNINLNSGTVKIRGNCFANNSIISDNADFSAYISKENAGKMHIINPDEYVLATAGNPDINNDLNIVVDSLTTYNLDTINTDNNINLKNTDIILSDTIISNNDIIATAQKTITDDEDVTLFSKNGDISLTGKNIELTGVLYAPNGKVEINADTFLLNGIIVADTITLNTQKAMINEAPSLIATFDFCYYNDMMDVGLNSHYTTSATQIPLNWNTQFPEGTFDFYVSTDGQNYNFVETLTDTKNYTYKVSGQPESLYFKLFETLDNGYKVESEIVPLVYNADLHGYILSSVDTDNDGLSNSREYFLHTNKYLKDTDGDGLKDNIEVYLTGTDPLYKDSDEDGISDYYDDEDGDGISNYTEVSYSTNAKNKDSDGDGLSDNSEINGGKTKATKSDTDGDGIADNDEIFLGLDPSNANTFGVCDKDYISLQKISSDNSVLSNINTDNEYFKLSIDANVANVFYKNLICSESLYSHAIDNSAILGDSPQIYYDENYKTKNATIKFKINSDYITSASSLFSGNAEFEGIKKYNIFKYCEENATLVAMETVYNSDTVSTVDNDPFGTYCLIDMEKLLDNLGYNGTSQSSGVIFATNLTKSALDITSTADSDGDAIADKNEIGDALTISQKDEMLCELYNKYGNSKITEFLKSLDIVTLNSNPKKADTDGDGIDDSDDNLPLKYSYKYYNDELELLKLSHPDWNFEFENYNFSLDKLTQEQYDTQWTSSIYKSSQYAIPFLISGNKVSTDFINRVKQILLANDMDITDENIRKITNRALDSGYTLMKKEGLEFYADPQTYLNEKYIYAFLNLGFDAKTYNKQTLKELCTDSFYDSNVTAYSIDNYVDFMYNAGTQNNINPYYLAIKSFVEHGAKVSSGDYHIMIKGYPLNIDGKRATVYNFGGIGAYNGPGAVYDSAVYAYEHGWTTPKNALIGMAEFTAKNYISIGQDNFYLQRFDINSIEANKRLHQYGTAANMVTALSNNYYTYLSPLLKESPATFVIPVFD